MERGIDKKKGKAYPYGDRTGVSPNTLCKEGMHHSYLAKCLKTHKVYKGKGYTVLPPYPNPNP